MRNCSKYPYYVTWHPTGRVQKMICEGGYGVNVDGTQTVFSGNVVANIPNKPNTFVGTANFNHMMSNYHYDYKMTLDGVEHFIFRNTWNNDETIDFVVHPYQVRKT